MSQIRTSSRCSDPAERIADHVHEAGYGRSQALNGIRQQAAGIPARVAAGEPDRPSASQFNGLLQRHRLPVPGAGDQADRAGVEPVSDPSRERRPGDPPGCQQGHACDPDGRSRCASRIRSTPPPRVAADVLRKPDTRGGGNGSTRATEPASSGSAARQGPGGRNFDRRTTRSWPAERLRWSAPTPGPSWPHRCAGLRGAMAAPRSASASGRPRRGPTRCDSDLERLADRLLEPGPVATRGVALTQELLTDGAGPLFWTESADDLGARLRTVLEALEPRDSHPRPETEGRSR